MTRGAGIGSALLAGLLAAAVFATAIRAEPPYRSPVPPARPDPVGDTAADPTTDPIEALIESIIRPQPRPQPHPGHAPNVVQRSAAESAPYTALAVASSPVPPRRPAGLGYTGTAVQTAPAVTPIVLPRATRRGAVCGVNQIKGVELQSIPGKVAGCGVTAPVKLSSVSGVALSQQPIMDCPTAIALNTWVRETVLPNVGRLGGGVAQIRIVAHYACRTRNNQPGAKISEHGKGHAVDIAGIILKNGVELSVLKHWRSPQHAKVMKALWKGACGPFGTVLGPDADRYHQDHFHFDTARYRSGSYCR